MRMLIAALLLAGLALPAAAASCNPPGGMNFPQWLSVCGPALQQSYMEGQGQGYPFPVFAQAMYQVYLRPPMVAPQMSAGGGGAPVGMCQLGQTACFSGWARVCELRGNTPMWITGAQRCAP